MDGRPSILIVDDDPSHLQIYTWILNAAGFHSVPALVHGNGIDLPENSSVDLVLLDYRLTGSMTAVDAAQILRQRYADARIVVLSDVFGLPSDIAPFVCAFVRKGQPELLIATLSKLVNNDDRHDSGPEQPGAARR
ncbi:MAG TPA: response regulator [Acidobacteriaceae bacterium]|nr:response regulator [Acidobacteriaceae bacterium]